VERVFNAQSEVRNLDVHLDVSDLVNPGRGDAVRLAGLGDDAPGGRDPGLRGRDGARGSGRAGDRAGDELTAHKSVRRWLTLGNLMMPSQLVELGQRAFDAVAAGVARGDPLVKCQLLASEFYEALKRELRQTRPDDSKRATLIAVASRCECVAIADIRPGTMLSELGNVLAMLRSDQPTPPPQRGPGPFLRVIKGGLSIS